MKNFCIFLCGDVMTGRGIDQILPHPSKPQLYESFVADARDYVTLAEMAHGKIHYPVTPDYIWGDALSFWEELSPDVKIINLETAITQSDDYWPEKGINYRMHPSNINVLKVASIDICTLANNHTLDWGYTGLNETLTTLKNADILSAGAGENLQQAMQPAIFKLSPTKRVLVFSVTTASSGTPTEWAASANGSGLYYLPNLHSESLLAIEENINRHRQSGDLIIFSIHWGGNWGYEVSESFRLFARSLIDKVHTDVVFGHSSHHPRPIELYQGKPVLYGCGDFINDYEGVYGYELFRGDLVLMHFLEFDSSLEFTKMTLIPLQINKFRLRFAAKKDRQWLLQRLNHSDAYSTQFTLLNGWLVYNR